MAYRRTARKARTSNRRVSRSAVRSVRRTARPARRSSGSRRSNGHNTLRIVLEQPSANSIQRPDALDLKASQSAHAAVLANAKSKF